MAKKKTDEPTKVTRITANDATPKKSAPAKKPAKAKSAVTPVSDEQKGLWSRFLGYFSGAWYELNQVRWPNRRATWSLTGAVLAFTLFFVVFILLLDALFKFIFEAILK